MTNAISTYELGDYVIFGNFVRLTTKIDTLRLQETMIGWTSILLSVSGL